MLLKPEEKMYLLNRLPALELSYEPKLHKKVYAPAYYIIPKGPKALIWYTYWHEQNVCLLIKLNERGNYSDVQLFPTTFSDDLALGTIIYGTYFIYTNRNYFTAEQLYYYKGLPVNKKLYLNLLLELFTKHIGQVAYTADSLVVGLPVLTETYEEALAQEVPYQTYGIAAVRHDGAPTTFAPTTTSHATSHATTSHATTSHATSHAPYVPPHTKHASTAHANAFAHKAVFKVRADLAADNYQLYTAEDIFYETAMVPTYKCSVMMNALFRNIKENANLDLLEESDEEGEFENTQIDKFVDLAKTVFVECIYSKRFKKWQPVKSLSHAKIITLKELQHFNSKK
jgi:hypothetical protein